jgi:undecaprenyl-diphosphatase
METQILLWIHGHASPGLDAAFGLSHLLGGPHWCVPVVVLAAAWHLRRGEGHEALVWLSLGLAILASEWLVKPLVARPRPELWPRLVAPSGYSFPSGHSLASATVFPLAGFMATRGRRWGVRACWLMAGGAIAAFIGVGRLYLGVHWPSDVLAGWLLGVTQVVLAVRWLDWRRAARRPGSGSQSDR